MFNLFRRNCLYNESIEPHCAYCAHCKPDNEYQGVCEFRGIVAMAGSCRRFTYDALRRKPPKPARIRGRFTDEDFFFEEKENQPSAPPSEKDKPEQKKPLIADDLSEFADLWEDDEPAQDEPSGTPQSEPEQPESEDAEPERDAQTKPDAQDHQEGESEHEI